MSLSRKNLLQKLLNIQASVDEFIKDRQNKEGGGYKYVSSDEVLNKIRPKMVELGLLLNMSVTKHELHAGETKSGTVRYLTEMDVRFTWIDVESEETWSILFYAQGVDLAGEKGVGKALTYAEKYFLMKQFHVPTSKDDPDSDGRIKSGEKRLKGTQADKENTPYYKSSITQMLSELCGGDAENIKKSLLAFTKNDARKYAGTDDVAQIAEAALPVVYAKVKEKYKLKKGAEFLHKALPEGATS